MKIKSMLGFCQCKGCRKRYDCEVELTFHVKNGGMRTQNLRFTNIRKGAGTSGRGNVYTGSFQKIMRQVLKYPGSKWNIAGQLVNLIPSHHSYVEPYFGSGAVLFNKPPSDIETINDLDSDVTNLFRCIQKDSQRLARLVMTTPYSREIYDNEFDDTESTRYLSSFQRAAGFLVRCWQGHGFRTNGYKVGWRNDVVGRERSYALWSWYRLPVRIIDIAERLRMVQIENRPALEVIERFDYGDVFFFLDPPYLLGTRRAKQYKHEMTDADHEELLKVILRSKAKVMISGYESDMYNDYLAGWHKESFQSCAEHAGPRRETVWMNYDPDGQISITDIPGVMP